MSEIRKAFANPDTAKDYEYTGDWVANGKEKRIGWPKAKFDGLVCEMTPAQAQKFIDLGHAQFKKKNAAPVAPKTEKKEKE